MLADLSIGTTTLFFDSGLSALRVLTSFDEAIWVHVARGERTIGSAHDVWEGAYKRAVEAAPDRADLLFFEWSEATP